MSGPTLSVVLPNYNHGRYLADAILGIASQSRPPDEFLILDDGSTDNSLQVIEPFLSRFPFLRLLRHEKNQGVMAACARLTAEARGDYIFHSAADDTSLPGFFADVMQLAHQYPQAGLLFGIVAVVDETGRQYPPVTASQWQEPLYAAPERFLNEYLSVEYPSHSACGGTIYRRDCFLEVGGYRPGLGSWADTFAFRAIGLKFGVVYLPHEVIKFRRLPGSYSQQSDAQPRLMLDLIARAEFLMKSPEFQDRFPADYVRRWRQAYRWQVIRDYYLGPESSSQPRPSFVARNVRRLPRLWRTLSLLRYPGALVEETTACHGSLAHS